jgi:hypothetical protein
MLEMLSKMCQIMKTCSFGEFDKASDNLVLEVRWQVVEEAVLTSKFGNLQIFDF